MHAVSTNHIVDILHFNDNGTRSVNETWPVYVIFQKKKFHQKILRKMRPEN